ncbi:aldo/keto reductase [Rhizobium sp. No.120]
MYENETFVGAALVAAGVARRNVFVTKVWHDSWNHRHGVTPLTQTRLKLDYVDLFLIHWPANDFDMAASLEPMMLLQETGSVRAIGSVISIYPWSGTLSRLSERPSQRFRSNITHS